VSESSENPCDPVIADVSNIFPSVAVKSYCHVIVSASELNILLAG
ncbi:9399_t:CDS:1, partial [Racocetra persica]